MSRLQILEPNASLRFECDGADLHYEVWEPENAAVRGTLYHSHGVCESNETTNTQRLVQRAVARGWRVVCLEHEGHGLSSGARAVVSMDRCVQLFEAFVRARLGEGAWALSGASMGANVVLYAAQRLSSLDGYVGTVLFGAAVGVDPRGVPPAVVVGALRVASFFMPEASLGATPVEEPDGYALPADSTRNFRGHWPLVTAKELLDATRDALADAKASKRGLDRILVVHGAQDHVVPLSCVQEFLAAARLPPEALRVVKKGGHDLTGGRGGDEACAAALDWLEEDLER